MAPPGWVPAISQGPDGPYAQCPDCDTKISTGVGGIGNLTKQHMNTTTCENARIKRDEKKAKQEQVEKQKNRMKGWLSGAIGKGKKKFVPSTVTKPSTPKSSSSKPAKTPHAAPAPHASNTPSCPPGQDLVARLEDLISRLPSDTPEGLPSEPLARLHGDPSVFDDITIPGEDLWEESLNVLMKGVFGWPGLTEKPDMSSYIRRGDMGLDCLPPFCRYFLDRGVPVNLFEGKLAHLMKELQDRTCNTIDAATDAQATSPPPTATHAEDPGPTTRRPRSNSLAPEGLPVQETIDLTSFEYEDTIQNSSQRQSSRCTGYALLIPNLSSTVRRYPFPIHDPELFPNQHLVPWEARTKNGMVVVISKKCREFSTGDDTVCTNCRQLERHKTLQGILERMESGTHSNAPLIWHGFDSIRAKLDRKNEQIEFHRLRSLNQAKTLLRKAAALTEHKRVLMAISSGSVQRVDRVIHLALKQKKGIRGIAASLYAASQGLYHAKSFTEREARHAVLIWRLGGNRVAEANHRALNTPGLTYLRKISRVPPLTASPGAPTKDEVLKNAKSTVGGLLDGLKERFGDTPVRHAVMMYDELKTESRIRYDLLSNHFLGVCREHASHVSLQFINEGDMKALFRAIDNEKIHCAGEATIAALGIISHDTRIYAARPILVSGDCKRETGVEHSRNVLDPTIDAMRDLQKETNIRVTSIASDGEARRGAAFVTKTFKKVLSEDSPIYPLLQPLKLLDLHCGDDDLTCDKDWKHVIKRFRNLLLRQKGIVVDGVRITPDITREHLRQAGVHADHIRAIFTPNDKQDVKLAYDLLQAIWSLPAADPSKPPGFLAARNALRLLGRLLYHMVFPYLCVELSLSEQIEHLSTAAHLALTLYLKDGTHGIPTNLFIDFNIMIKNILFSIAKAKVDIPGSDFHIILLGTDRLETLFGILRTMIGNDANLDILQLACRLASTTEVSNIFAEYPEWDRGPRRLKLPVLSRDSKELHNRADHIMPSSWKGDVNVDHVSLQTSWNEGRRQVEEIFPGADRILAGLDGKSNHSMLAPRGSLLFDVVPDDEIDDSLDVEDPATAPPTSTPAGDRRVDIEDELLADAHGGEVLINGANVSKARALSRYSKYRISCGPNSTDRLRRVQGVSRYTKVTGDDNEDDFTLSDSDEYNESLPNDVDVLSISDPIATLLSCESQTWLALGEVNSLKVDGKPVDYVSFDMLAEETVVVSYQLLKLQPSTTEEDPTLANDWRTHKTEKERTFSVPGALVSPVNPDVSTTHDSDLPWYLLASNVLVSLAASLSQEVMLQSEGTVKKIPNITRSTDFPYLERTGEACFLCSNSEDITEHGESYCPSTKCSQLALDVKAKSQSQKVIEHMASHILTEPALTSSTPLCGLCLQPPPLCVYFLKKGKGAKANLKVDDVRSKGCLLKVNFTYGTAMKYKKSSPCTNVPIICPLCPSTEPAIWRYFLKKHMHTKHGRTLAEEHRDLWEISLLELNAVKSKYAHRSSLGVAKKKKKEVSLKVSEAHRSRIPSGVPTGKRSAEDSGDEPDAESSHAEESDDELPQGVSDGGSDGEEDSDDDLPEVEEVLRSARERLEGGSGGAAINNVPPAEGALVGDSAGFVGEVGDEQHLVGDVDNTISCALPVPAETALTPVNDVSISASAEMNVDGRNEDMPTGSGRPRRAAASAMKKRHVERDCEGCGEIAVEGREGVIQCRQKGCETQWFHRKCVTLDKEPPHWVCNSCKGNKRSRY